VTRIAAGIHHRFYSLPDEIRCRAEREYAARKQHYNRYMSGYMTGTYWKTHKRLTISFTLPEWEHVVRFAAARGSPPTTAFREAAFARIAETVPAAAAGPGSARPSPPLSSGGPALRQRRTGLPARAVRIEKAIDRIGVNINQTVRHIHTNKNAALGEIRACHRLLNSLKQEVSSVLAADAPPPGNT
jgi:hypothetical protein